MQVQSVFDNLNKDLIRQWDNRFGNPKHYKARLMRLLKQDEIR